MYSQNTVQDFLKNVKDFFSMNIPKTIKLYTLKWENFMA